MAKSLLRPVKRPQKIAIEQMCLDRTRIEFQCGSDFLLGFAPVPDRKSTRLNSSHTEIYTLPLHDALPISVKRPQKIAIEQMCLDRTRIEFQCGSDFLLGFAPV